MAKYSVKVLIKERFERGEYSFDTKEVEAASEEEAKDLAVSSVKDWYGRRGWLHSLSISAYSATKEE